jgi:glycosyltransferase involved in cell wall biosynthesis
MKIAVNTRFLLKENREGVGRYIEETFSRIVRAHPEHEFIFLFDRPFDPAFIFADNVRGIVLPPPARHPILFVLWYEIAVTLTLRRLKADVFVSPDNFCSLATKVPTLLVIHDLAFLHFPTQIKRVQLWYYRFFTPKFIKKARRITCVSEYTKNDVMQQYQVAAERLSVCYSGVRPIFKPLAEAEKAAVRAEFSDGKPYFFYIGAVHPRKNVHRLIAAFDAFKTATGSDFKLIIAGRFAWQTGEVKAAYDAATHRADVLFLGYVPDEISPKLMAASYAVLFVSQFEGFGVPIVEALNCEVPIITSNVSSMPEIAGEAGILADPNRTETITAAMQQLFLDKDFYNQMVEKGRAQQTKFTWDFTAATVWKAIEECV